MSDPGNVMGLWEGFGFGGADDTTYQAGIPWLEETCATIEDWGCGPAYAKRFIRRARYTGIDGSRQEGVDVIADLRYYCSSPDGIFMRHVLEHNWNWDQVLSSALLSFTKRMVLVMFTPFGEQTMVMPGTEARMVPDISFRRDDLLGFFGALLHHEASFVTSTQYGAEHVFFLARDLVNMHSDPGVAEAAAGPAAGHADPAS